jgi:hypothetical protein
MKFITLLFLLFFSSISLAWDGYDYANGTYIEIEKGNNVKAGKDIEIFDYATGQYRDVQVESVRGSGSNTEVEVFDYTTGEFRTLDME